MYDVYSTVNTLIHIDQTKSITLSNLMLSHFLENNRGCIQKTVTKMCVLRTEIKNEINLCIFVQFIPYISIQ